MRFAFIIDDLESDCLAKEADGLYDIVVKSEDCKSIKARLYSGLHCRPSNLWIMACHSAGSVDDPSR